MNSDENVSRLVKWFGDTFFAWRGRSRQTVTAFAEMLTISQPQASDIMNGRIRELPTAATIAKIGAVYPEVYDVIGLVRPSTDNPLDSLPPKYQYVRDAINEASRQIRERNLSKDSDEAEEVVKEVFSKYGMEYLGTKKGE